MGKFILLFMLLFIKIGTHFFCQQQNYKYLPKRFLQTLGCNKNQYFDYNLQSCKSCHNECSTCLGPYDYQCLKCSQNSLYAQFGKCTKYCLEQTYLEIINDQKVCQPCFYQCQTCNGPLENQCLTCISTEYFYEDGKCKEDCKGQIPLCKVCSINLIAQSKAFGQIQCIECYNGFFLNKEKQCLNFSEIFLHNSTFTIELKLHQEFQNRFNQINIQLKLNNKLLIENDDYILSFKQLFWDNKKQDYFQIGENQMSNEIQQKQPMNLNFTNFSNISNISNEYSTDNLITQNHYYQIINQNYSIFNVVIYLHLIKISQDFNQNSKLEIKIEDKIEFLIQQRQQELKERNQSNQIIEEVKVMGNSSYEIQSTLNQIRNIQQQSYIPLCNPCVEKQIISLQMNQFNLNGEGACKQETISSKLAYKQNRRQFDILLKNPIISLAPIFNSIVEVSIQNLKNSAFKYSTFQVSDNHFILNLNFNEPIIGNPLLILKFQIPSFLQKYCGYNVEKNSQTLRITLQDDYLLDENAQNKIQLASGISSIFVIIAIILVLLKNFAITDAIINANTGTALRGLMLTNTFYSLKFLNIAYPQNIQTLFLEQKDLEVILISKLPKIQQSEEDFGQLPNIFEFYGQSNYFLNNMGETLTYILFFTFICLILYFSKSKLDKKYKIYQKTLQSIQTNKRFENKLKLIFQEIWWKKIIFQSLISLHDFFVWDFVIILVISKYQKLAFNILITLRIPILNSKQTIINFIVSMLFFPLLIILPRILGKSQAMLGDYTLDEHQKKQKMIEFQIKINNINIKKDLLSKKIKQSQFHLKNKNSLKIVHPNYENNENLIPISSNQIQTPQMNTKKIIQMYKYQKETQSPSPFYNPKKKIIKLNKYQKQKLQYDQSSHSLLQTNESSQSGNYLINNQSNIQIAESQQVSVDQAIDMIKKAKEDLSTGGREDLFSQEKNPNIILRQPFQSQNNDIPKKKKNFQINKVNQLKQQFDQKDINNQKNQIKNIFQTNFQIEKKEKLIDNEVQSKISKIRFGKAKMQQLPDQNIILINQSEQEQTEELNKIEIIPKIQDYQRRYSFNYKLLNSQRHQKQQSSYQQQNLNKEEQNQQENLNPRHNIFKRNLTYSEIKKLKQQQKQQKQDNLNQFVDHKFNEDQKMIVKQNQGLVSLEKLMPFRQQIELQKSQQPKQQDYIEINNMNSSKIPRKSRTFVLSSKNENIEKNFEQNIQIESFFNLTKQQGVNQNHQQQIYPISFINSKKQNLVHNFQSEQELHQNLQDIVDNKNYQFSEVEKSYNYQNMQEISQNINIKKANIYQDSPQNKQKNDYNINVEKQVRNSKRSSTLLQQNQGIMKQIMFKRQFSINSNDTEKFSAIDKQGYMINLKSLNNLEQQDKVEINIQDHQQNTKIRRRNYLKKEEEEEKNIMRSRHQKLLHQNLQSKILRNQSSTNEQSHAENQEISFNNLSDIIVIQNQQKLDQLQNDYQDFQQETISLDKQNEIFQKTNEFTISNEHNIQARQGEVQDSKQKSLYAVSEITDQEDLKFNQQIEFEIYSALRKRRKDKDKIITNFQSNNEQMHRNIYSALLRQQQDNVFSTQPLSLQIKKQSSQKVCVQEILSPQFPNKYSQKKTKKPFNYKRVKNLAKQFVQQANIYIKFYFQLFYIYLRFIILLPYRYLKFALDCLYPLYKNPYLYIRQILRNTQNYILIDLTRHLAVQFIIVMLYKSQLLAILLTLIIHLIFVYYIHKIKPFKQLKSSHYITLIFEVSLIIFLISCFVLYLWDKSKHRIVYQRLLLGWIQICSLFLLYGVIFGNNYFYFKKIINNYKINQLKKKRIYPIVESLITQQNNQLDSTSRSQLLQNQQENKTEFSFLQAEQENINIQQKDIF